MLSVLFSSCCCVGGGEVEYCCEVFKFEFCVSSFCVAGALLVLVEHFFCLFYFLLILMFVVDIGKCAPLQIQFVLCSIF